MTRLFTENAGLMNRKTYELFGEDAKYLSDILRMKIGDELTICDETKTEYLCRIGSITRDCVSVEISFSKENRTEPPYEAILYQALVKGDKMELIIQKAVELGVSRIVPVACQRSVVRLEGKDLSKKIERWQKISLEAARQCGRGIIPPICMPLTYKNAIKESVSSSDLVFIPWENENNVPLPDLFRQQEPIIPSGKSVSRQRISFFIGPEGGFDSEEIRLAEQANIKTVTLGPRILRTETAGLAVLSMMIYRLELNCGIMS